jgi:hypothetical protein
MVPTAAEHAAQPHFSQLQQQLLQDREMQEAEGERAAKEVPGINVKRFITVAFHQTFYSNIVYYSSVLL